MFLDMYKKNLDEKYIFSGENSVSWQSWIPN